MTGVVAIFLLAGMLALVPARVDGWALRHGASPEILAVLATVTLVGIAAVPVTFVICTGTLAPHSTDRSALSVASAVGLLLVALAAGRTLGRMVRVRRRWAALSRVAAALELRQEPDGINVLPLDELLAFVSGSEAFISRGLLDRLTPEQRLVVVEHEREHAQRGHARLLSTARAIGHGTFGLPAARHAAGVLDRELDAVADHAAAHRAGGSPAVQETVRAVAAAVSERPDSDLDQATRQRLDRLSRADTKRRSFVDGIVRATALLVGALVLASICLSIHTGPVWLGVLACSLVIVGFVSLTQPVRQPNTARRRTKHTPKA